MPPGRSIGPSFLVRETLYPWTSIEAFSRWAEFAPDVSRNIARGTLSKVEVTVASQTQGVSADFSARSTASHAINFECRKCWRGASHFPNPVMGPFPSGFERFQQRQCYVFARVLGRRTQSCLSRLKKGWWPTRRKYPQQEEQTKMTSKLLQ